jgi:hypothetical protein
MALGHRYLRIDLEAAILTVKRETAQVGITDQLQVPSPPRQSRVEGRASKK